MDASAVKGACYTALLVLAVAGCGAPPRGPQAPRATEAPEARPQAPRVAAPRRVEAAPSVPEKRYPECDPRADDPDRGRASLGMLIGDCQDERGANGVFVTRLMTVRGMPSPAQGAGIRAGDRIVAVDACAIGTTHELASQLRRSTPGWVARVVIERGGRTQELFVSTIGMPGKPEAPGQPHLSTAGCRAIGRPAAK